MEQPVYWDSCAFIHLFQQTEEHKEALNEDKGIDLPQRTQRKRPNLRFFSVLSASSVVSYLRNDCVADYSPGGVSWLRVSFNS